jgi:DNA-binding transcriptional LysR family regulator
MAELWGFSMDRLASINAFVRVAEDGGFSAAARRLHLSKATLSEQVQALENALGARLLNRTTRRVSLTEVGREYYERCLQILLDLEEADQAAGALQSTPHGQLRVHCNQGIARFVTPVATDYLARHPGVSIDLRTGDELIDLVREGFDVAITCLTPPDSILVRRRLGAVSLRLYAAPSYLENHPPPQRPADLAEHNCLRYAHFPWGDEWHFVDADGNQVKTRVSGSLITNYAQTIRAAGAAGIGLVLMSPVIISDLLESGALVPVMPGYRTPEFEIDALYPHRRHMTAKLRVFIDMLADRFADEQWWLNGEPDGGTHEAVLLGALAPELGRPAQPF